MDQRNLIKINFDYFQIQKQMLKQLEQQNFMKKWGQLSSFHVSFLIYGL